MTTDNLRSEENTAAVDSLCITDRESKTHCVDVQGLRELGLL